MTNGQFLFVLLLTIAQLGLGLWFVRAVRKRAHRQHLIARMRAR